MFDPPFCPKQGCRHHDQPEAGFFIRFGYYKAKCRPHPVPRFRCSHCGKTFSRQTFRMDCYDHKPHLNKRLFELLISGVGLRQSARILKLGRHNTEMKARKMARHCRDLNHFVRGPLPDQCELQLDELETYETRRNTRPLTLPILIEAKSRFLIWAESAPIRPNGTMSKRRLAAIAADDAKFGPRKDESVPALKRTLAKGFEMLRHLKRVHFETDEKRNYPALIAEAFKGLEIEHGTTNSKVQRDTVNPLFPINQTEAIARDLMGRLRRESWLVSKKRVYLNQALQVFTSFRNLVRRRFNKDKQSAAQHMGLTSRRLSPNEVLGWRRDFGFRQSALMPDKWRVGCTLEDYPKKAAQPEVAA